MILVVGANLMFASKVLETARALGLPAESAGPESEKLATAKLVLVDVEKLGAEGLLALRARTTARMIGFASHVAEQALAAAREAGCDAVLSRGQFSAQLPRLLQSVAP